MCAEGVEAEVYYKQIAADILIAMIEAQADELKLRVLNGEGEMEEYDDMSADRCLEYYAKILKTVKA